MPRLHRRPHTGCALQLPCLGQSARETHARGAQSMGKVRRVLTPRADTNTHGTILHHFTFHVSNISSCNPRCPVHGYTAISSADCDERPIGREACTRDWCGASRSHQRRRGLQVVRPSQADALYWRCCHQHGTIRCEAEREQWCNEGDVNQTRASLREYRHTGRAPFTRHRVHSDATIHRRDGHPENGARSRR